MTGSREKEAVDERISDLFIPSKEKECKPILYLEDKVENYTPEEFNTIAQRLEDIIQNHQKKAKKKEEGSKV